MNLVEKENRIINQLIEIYSNSSFQDHLQNTTKMIEGIFKNLLVDHGEEFELISKNSVRDLKFFSIVSRIKEADSLKEKFYRSNLLQKEFSTYKTATGPVLQSTATKNHVRELFQAADDVIGIKILTDLNEDCKKVLSLIRTYLPNLERQHIKLDNTDLQAQPSRMKNGLDIYKIRCSYHEFKFELQIKSKIVSAWGDMEHAIFYKDYYISPVRESTQATMSHIGKLLFQIDDFLLSVREANKEYKKNADVSAFLSWLDRNYAAMIKQKLGGVGFKLDGISEALFRIKINNGISDNVFKNRNLSLDHLSLKPKDPNLLSYTRLRNTFYELKIFESIVFSWLWRPSQVTSNTIDTRLNEFIKVIQNFITETVLKEFEALERKRINRKVVQFFDTALKYKPIPAFFLSTSIWVKHFAFSMAIESELEVLHPDDNVAKENLRILELLALLQRVSIDPSIYVADRSFDQEKKLQLKKLIGDLTNVLKGQRKKDFEREVQILDDVSVHLN
jgi:ppGpp synthetase/RelA/SpoT-type nucleotidyltranferase